MARPLVDIVPVIADQDKKAARRLFEQLAKPMASYRMEHHRTLLRLFIAEGLGQEYVLEALKDMEPSPPWMGPLLHMRAETYKAAKHPLADQAREDWELFKRNAK
jgi:alkylated DNA repair dioxygenase AlkB